MQSTVEDRNTYVMQNAQRAVIYSNASFALFAQQRGSVDEIETYPGRTTVRPFGKRRLSKHCKMCEVDVVVRGQEDTGVKEDLLI